MYVCVYRCVHMCILRVCVRVCVCKYVCVCLYATLNTGAGDMKSNSGCGVRFHSLLRTEGEQQMADSGNWPADAASCPTPALCAPPCLLRWLWNWSRSGSDIAARGYPGGQAAAGAMGSVLSHPLPALSHHQEKSFHCRLWGPGLERGEECEIAPP